MTATTGKPTLTEVKIDDVDVSSYILTRPEGWKKEDTIGEVIKDITINLVYAVSSVITVDEDSLIGKSVTVKRGVTTSTEEFVFEGEVTQVQPAGNAVTVIAKDKLYEGVRKEVTKSFDKNIDTEAGEISEIFKTLWNDNTDLTASGTSVQDSGTVLVLIKFICNHADVYERSQALAKLLNWQMYYNPVISEVVLEPQQYVAAGIVLTVGDNITEVPKWDFNSDKQCNKVTIVGAEQEVETTQFFSGDGAETVSTLDKMPTSVKVYVGAANFDPGAGTFPHDDNDNLQVGGKDGATSGSFDYQVDEENSTVTFESGSIPSNNTNNVEILYSYMQPTPVVSSNSVSIGTYGERRKTLFKSEIKTSADAEVYANKYVEFYKDPFVSATLKVTNVKGLEVGQSVRVVDNNNNIDRTLRVTKITKSYPYSSDRVTVGELGWEEGEWEDEVVKRIRRIEESAGRSQDLLVHVFDVTRDMTFERRYMKLEKRSSDPYVPATDIFILGDATYGVLGTSKLGDNIPFLESQIIPGNLTYGEYLYDTDLIDTTSTTATVDTTNNEVQF